METTACGSWKSMLDNRVKADIVNVNKVMDAYAQRREPENSVAIRLEQASARGSDPSLTPKSHAHPLRG